MINLFRRHSFVRFVLVGGAFAGIYSIITAFVIGRTGVAPPIASTLVWLLLIPPAYHCQRRVSFAGQAPRRGALGFYALSQGISMVIVAVMGTLFVTGRMVEDTAIYLLASGMAAVSSYALNRLLVFGPQN